MAVFKNIATINPTDGNPFYVLSLQSSEFVLGSSAGDFTFGIVLPKVNQTGTIKLVPGMKFTITDRDGYITSGGPQIFRHVNETSTVIINGQSITASVGYSMMDVPFTSYVLTYNGDGIWTMLEGADGNITGATGATGAQGDRGFQGFQGNNSTVAGQQGSQGATGTGAQGTQGNQGPDGIQGTAGSQGTQGRQGPTGIGTTGSQGTTGQGFSIHQIYNSVEELLSNTIPDGLFGLVAGTLPQDDPNYGSLYLYTAGTWTYITDMSVQGAAGIQGTQGGLGSQGRQGPTGVQGAVGSQGNQGPTGLQGIEGQQGTEGQQGDQGTTGPQGEQGTYGAQGNDGINGINGDQGATGPQGNTGAQGRQGPTGQQGNQGNQGDTGPQGIEGQQGNQGPTGDQGTAGTNGSVGGGIFYANLYGGQIDELGSWMWVNGFSNNEYFTPTATYALYLSGNLYTDSTFTTAIDIESIRLNHGAGDYIQLMAVDGSGFGTYKITSRYDSDTPGHTNGSVYQLQGIGGAGIVGNNVENYEVSVSFQKSGPQGYTGSTGPQGTTGAQGIQGTFGQQGNQGPTGLQGTLGQQGNQGPTGLQGTFGAQGDQGLTSKWHAEFGAPMPWPHPYGEEYNFGDHWLNADTGDVFEFDGMEFILVGNIQGPTGIQGTTGTQGNQGPTGTGAQGTAGAQGNQGPTGLQGNQGPTGIQGNIGQGFNIYQIYNSVEELLADNIPSGLFGLVAGTLPQSNSDYGALYYYDGEVWTYITDMSVQGAAGIQGTTGAQGRQGPTGVQGNQGPTGIQGTLGQQGNQGPTGFQGNQGPTGIQGTFGQQGNQGPTGLQGTIGQQGNQGPTGIQGTFGQQGNQGPNGIQGTVGTQGFQGRQGPQGNQGPTGIQGTLGNQGFQGLSLNWRGEYALNTYYANDVISYSGSAWICVVDNTYDLNPGDGEQTSWQLLAAQGSQGFTGNNGAQGNQGRQGPTGIQGTFGAQGNQGPTGIQGTVGTQGFQGNQGPTGIQGTFGAQGNQGPTGFQGNQGASAATSITNNTDNYVVTATGNGATPFNGESLLQFDGSALKMLFQSGDEGGEIFLNKAVTNTTLSGGITVDVWQDRLRFFESGGTARGAYIDLSATAAGVGTNLLAGGPQGNTGAQGRQGPQGLNGAQGNQGPTGIQGTVGAQGNQGPTGIQGTVGAQGNQGPTGIQGTVGAQGNQGPTGIQGTVGTDGLSLLADPAIINPNGEFIGAYYGQQFYAANGIIWYWDNELWQQQYNLTGPQGFTGGTGAQGRQGPNGPQGNQGPTGLQGTLGQQGNQGPTGQQGNQGPTGLQGTLGAQGNQGPTGIQGTVGAQGNQGPTGIQGTVGAQGRQGPTGDQGTVGAQGRQGPTGDQGTLGAQGRQGPTGIQGTVGAQGNQGPTGIQGTVGAQGNQGPTGLQGTLGAASTVAGPQGRQGPNGADSAVAGPQGRQGPTGIQGTAGTNATGTQGFQGIQGSAGSNSTVAGPPGPPGGSGTSNVYATAMDQYVRTIDSPTFADVTISSDARLKTNIEVITNALATIMQINGVTYNWSEEMLRMSPSKSGQTGYGFIAQELEKVLPHLVKAGDYKSIQYDGLIPILLQAIKELYLEIEKLKKNS